MILPAAHGGRRRGRAALPSSAPYNAAAPIVTPTYDGSGNTVHPDVVDMGTAWNGYRFWMAHTPYPESDDAYENPSILASHDGVTWTTPPGVTNPLYPRPGASYNSDVDLSYDPGSDELVLVYRTEGKTGVHVIARSPDGVTWPAAASPLAGWASPEQNVSPAVVHMPDGTWAMWGLGSPSRTLRRWTAPNIDGPWSGPSECTGLGPQAWHLDVVRIGLVLYAIIDDAKETGSAYDGIFVASSLDGLTWARNPAVMIQRGIAGAWDRGSLYRATIQPHENGTHMRVWYGGCINPTGAPEVSWRVGYTHIPLTEWPVPTPPA